MKEVWDVLNCKGEKINKKINRGEKLNDDEFHLVVNAWIKNKDDKFLIVQRSINKTYPLMWECVGGSALSCELPIETAIREVKEETGVRVYKTNAKLVGHMLRYYSGCPDILYVYLFNINNVKDDSVIIQKEEVNDYMWATKEQIIDLYKNNKFAANAFFLDVITK